jgi:hypothetical protein
MVQSALPTLCRKLRQSRELTSREREIFPSNIAKNTRRDHETQQKLPIQNVRVLHLGGNHRHRNRNRRNQRNQAHRTPQQLVQHPLQFLILHLKIQKQIEQKKYPQSTKINRIE